MKKNAAGESELKKSAQAALDQIDDKQYIGAMKQEGLLHFFKIGVFLYKTQIKLASGKL
ncbi:MAG: hypothetical protein KHX22_07205 [Clostridiales bacterium]|nr:hypothetical protein [Clostridiales bacterium]